ncbi:phosphatidylinositol-specific phospholipase C domain-containing protein [Bacillus cereus]
MALTPYYLHHDTIDTYNPNWMKDIKDDVLLSQISIPGTHETMAMNGIYGEIGKCQTLNLSTQLKAGIRYIDIRCTYESSKSDAGIPAPSFSIHHGIINEHKALGKDVLSVVTSFLQDNPSETILMRIKQEYSSEKDPIFSNTFQKYVDQYKSYFWDSKLSFRIPKLGEVRGKIVVLYDIADHQFGLPYSDTRLF